MDDRKLLKFDQDCNEAETYLKCLDRQATADHGDDDEDPFYVLDLDDVIDKYNLWRSELPMITPYYAVKCNPDVQILKVLVNAGCSFDCASEGELKCLFNFGVDPSRVIFANTYKPRQTIRYAALHGAHLMTCDTEDELYKIKEIDPDARVVIRIAPAKISVENKTGFVDLSMRFGCDLEGAGRLIQTCLQLELDLVGVSFHVGSDCCQASLWSESVKLAKHVFQMAQKAGFRMNVLDIGGGFPSDVSFFKKAASHIRTTISNEFPPESGVQVIAEPGRFMVESCASLISTVIGKQMRNDLMTYVLDVGLHNAFLVHGIIPCEERKHLPFVSKEVSETRRTVASMLYGPTCNSLDCIYRDPILLPELNLRDHVIFRNVGAYVMSISSSSFNGINLPGVYHVQKR